jgi:hypothetical protein
MREGVSGVKSSTPSSPESRWGMPKRKKLLTFEVYQEGDDTRVKIVLKCQNLSPEIQKDAARSAIVGVANAVSHLGFRFADLLSEAERAELGASLVPVVSGKGGVA